MNIGAADLNLLKYLDVLLREQNVTRAAEQLGITQPAMSNSLKRLRELFGDPLLIRTSDGMTATERAQELRPLVRQILSQAEQLFTPEDVFKPAESRRVFRIMTSDYAEATLVPHIVRRLRAEAPNVVLDFLTPSDVSYQDMEQGRVVIFAAGTGNPYFTTDTAAALRAAEMECEVLLKGTQVDGVYSADPNLDVNAERYERLSFSRVLREELKVMDASAISLARENRIPVLVFSIHNKGAFSAVVTGAGQYTLIDDQE